MTGGSDGIVNLWKIKNDKESKKYILERLSGYKISELEKDLPVQSLLFNENYIIAGCVNGDIYHLDMSKVNSSNSVKESKEYIKQIYRCWDQEECFRADFSYDSKHIFAITKKGSLSIYRVNDLALCLRDTVLTAEQNAVQKNHIINMFVCHLNPYLIICFLDEIRVFGIPDLLNGKLVRDYEFAQLSVKGEIIDMKINLREDFIAIAFNEVETNEPKVHLYSIDFQAKKFMIVNLSVTFSSIRFIDFSFDNYYLMYYDDTCKKDYYINLNEKVALYESEPKNDILCVNEGILHSKLENKIRRFFHENNPIQCILRLNDHVVISTDHFGTIRVFEIENDDVKVVQVYTQHLMDVSVCKMSLDQNCLLTSSKTDKAIYLWKIET